MNTYWESPRLQSLQDFAASSNACHVARVGGTTVATWECVWSVRE